MKPKRGEFYRHFKGKVYQVLGYALHHDTKEQLIIYKSFKDEITWVRPLTEFTDIHTSGVKRFVKEDVI